MHEQRSKGRALELRATGMTQQAIANELGVGLSVVQSWTCAEFPPPTPSERLWRGVKRGGPDECWPWTRYCMPEGYGQMGIGQRLVLVHRFAYETTHGSVSPDLFVCHSCDNPPCCNPAHLFVGTAADNHADMCAKGRQVVPVPLTGDAWRAVHMDALPRGERHPHARLSDAAVMGMRTKWDAGGRTQQSLADEFGTTQTTVSKIVRRATRV